LLKNKGFFLAELILSLAAWLVAAGVLFPLFLHASGQAEDNRKSSAAVQVLYEYLQMKAAGSAPVLENHESYPVEEVELDGLAVEVCVHYEKKGRQKEKICDIYFKE
jgi:type II secretory pathway pseudopilin PulG